MKNIAKGSNLSPPVTNFDPFLSIIFQSDKASTENEIRAEEQFDYTAPRVKLQLFFNVLHDFGFIDFVLILYCFLSKFRY